MRWTYGIKNKLVASLVLLALCALVLLSNYLDRVHTENVKKSISTMYEDRLIVEGYVLKMTKNIYQIREVLNSNQELQIDKVRRLSADVKTTYNLFIKTKLTATEKATADELLFQIKDFEKMVGDDHKGSMVLSDEILVSLDRLSGIQLEESRLIMKQVESQYGAIKASSQFAFAIVIIILIVLQVMVFSGESLIPPFKPKDPSLN